MPARAAAGLAMADGEMGVAAGSDGEMGAAAGCNQERGAVSEQLLW